MFDLSIGGSIARLRLNRAEARNAITLEGWARLADAAEEAERSGAQLLVVSGEGTAFCAGADLRGFNRFREDPQARSVFRGAIRHGLDRLRNLQIPSIAVIEGACYGAGVAVAMACDVRFAGPAARFAITPAKLGISYPQEDVHRLVALVGAGQAARLLLGAQAIGGAEAERIGLVEICFEDLSTVEQFIEAAAANAAASLRTLKRAVRLSEAGSGHDDEQDSMFDALLGGAELFDRLSAQRSRR